MLAEVLVVALVLALLSGVVTTLLRPGRAMARIEARPDGRIWFYRRFLLGGWTLALMALLPVVDSPRLALAHLGLTWSAGGVAGPVPSYAPALAWTLTAFLLLVLLISGNRLRHHVRAGGTVATREKAAPMFPHTPRERGLATAVAVTAGIAEEIVFRGLLVAAGVTLFDLPLVAACALSIALFAATHLYQGAQGVYGAAALAIAFTGITVLSGTLLPAMILHIAVDLIAFVHIPPPSRPTSTPAGHLRIPQPGALSRAELAAALSRVQVSATTAAEPVSIDSQAPATAAPALGGTAGAWSVPVVPGPEPVMKSAIPQLRRPAPEG
ncbi:CPBP family intramembrane glutamic endopeptidase [Actinoplanes sp. CA-131856]